MGKINFKAISKEDLLVKMRMLIAENTLLRKQSLEMGKIQSYVLELESKIEKLNEKKNLYDKTAILLSDSKMQINAQTDEIYRLKQLLDMDLVAKIEHYKVKIENQRKIIHERKKHG